jgi:type II secretory pathway predicted ATPase ExeA
MEYLSYWKMKEPPFESNCDARFFYESEAHSESLARLLYLVADRAMDMGTMTGEVGNGKTMVLNAMTSRLREDLYTTMKLRTAHLPFEHIVAEINLQLRGKGSAALNDDKYYLMKEFEQLLHSRVSSTGKHLVLILDEAQFLSAECLDELKCLTAYNHPAPVLTLILSGQPELKARLSAMPQIYQRLGMSCVLKNLRYEEMGAYLEHRLKTAGTENTRIFSSNSIDPIFSFSGGCPRQINRVCKLAIDRACGMKKTQIDADMIHLIVRDIEKHFG